MFSPIRSLVLLLGGCLLVTGPVRVHGDNSGLQGKAAPPGGKLSVQYRCGEPEPERNQIRLQIKIDNTGNEDMPLPELTVRYWFNADSEKKLNYWCDYAALGQGKITAGFHQLAKPAKGADVYLEIGFKDGVLEAGKDTGEIQNRIASEGWEKFNQANHFSFDGEKTSWTEFSRITLYRKGVLIWGIEPGGTVMAVKVVPEPAPKEFVPGKPNPDLVKHPSARRFLELYNDLHNPKNGYFSPEGIPYHSVETFMIEAPDYGHLTTSEAFSYWIWLEAAYGHMTGDWSKLAHAWDVLEKYIIPTSKDQPANNGYDPNKPAAFAREFDELAGYPAPLDFGAPVGRDPIARELKAAYGTSEIYGMHWLLDVDNWYGYGQRGDGKTRPSYINTFQRGPKESVWHTIPHPSWEAFNWGGRNGFLDLFVKDNNYTRQWRYTNAPDADARLVQAMYWAYTWAKAQGRENDVAVSKAVKMGDFLRYCFFDKYFKKMGCQNPREAGASGHDGAHYLLSWYYAWGGPTDRQQNWAFRIGCSHNHQGYQNPMAAWVLSRQAAFKPASANGAGDWSKSLDRQLELYRWLQSSEGAIAGGATNSWNGRYEKHPAGASTFHGMAYDWQPVWHDPPSNQWFGFQCWSMERVAEYFHATGDAKAKAILDKWVVWAMKETKLNPDGGYAIPAEMEWTGQPDPWDPAAPGENGNLHVKVVKWDTDIGIVGALAKTLLFYSAGTKRWAKEDGGPGKFARELLERAWKFYRDDRGLSAPEPRKDYRRIFEQEVYVPAGWQGKMANGDVIRPGIKFIDIRSRYKDDPDFARVKQAYDRKEDPVFRYHRFWAQVDYATACAYVAEFDIAQEK